jgi:hypothetical protein
VHWPVLSYLNLSDNMLMPEGAAALATARIPALRYLCLGDNHLGEGAEVLARGNWHSSLTIELLKSDRKKELKKKFNVVTVLSLLL